MVKGEGSGSPSGLLELRVHGVHGTPPQSMLGVTTGEIGQVAGDGLTSIYRTKSGQVPLRTLPPNVVVEAYSWSALTSGAAGVFGWLRRAAWLALLPFALLNIAYWARPELDWESKPTKQAQRAARVGSRVTRVAALMLTLMLVLTPLTIAVDLVGWQCFRDGNAGCPALPGWLSFLSDDWFRDPTRRIAVCTALPLLVIALMWLLSRTSIARYEAVREPKQGMAAPVGVPVLRHPSMWRGTARTRRLQRLHLTFALSAVIVYTGMPVLAVDRSTLLGPVDLAAAVLGVFTLCVVCRVRPGDVEHTDPVAKPKPRGLTLPGLMLCAVLLLLVLHLALLLFKDFDDIDESDGLVGRNLWFVAVFVVLTSLHVMLFLVGRAWTWFAVCFGGLVVPLFFFSSIYVAESFDWWGPRQALAAMVVVAVLAAAMGVWHYTRKNDEQAWRGAGASVFLTLSIWVALLFTTAAVTFVADRLNGPGQSVAALGTDHYAADERVNNDDGFVATGDVTIRNAVVDTAGDGIQVRSGEVVVGTLRPATSDGDVSASLTGRNLKGANLTIPSGSPPAPVAIKSTCVLGADVPVPKGGCTLERDDFHASGVVPHPQESTITVGTDTKSAHVKVLDPLQRPLTLPQVLMWATLLQLVWLVAVVAVALWCALRLRRKVGDRIRQRAKADDIGPSDEDACVQARLRAAQVHRAEKLLELIGRCSAVLAIVLIIGASTGQAPWNLTNLDGLNEVGMVQGLDDQLDFDRVEGVLKALAGLGLWTALLSSTVIVAAAAGMRKSESARKGVGILWDLTTFWPRAAHPFAPPCYAERVVPELLIRTRWALDERPTGQNLVVLSGHSQGSTLVVAAASRLGDDDLARVRIITYGSQIRAWYGRIFPAVFGPDAVGYRPTTGTPSFDDPDPDAPATTVKDPVVAPADGSLFARLGGPQEHPHWVNLFRRSDPLGFRVFSDADSDLDVYVREVPEPAAGDPGPHVMTHSGYPHTREYRKTLARWEMSLARPAGSGAPNLPATLEPPLSRWAAFRYSVLGTPPPPRRSRQPTHIADVPFIPEP